MIPLILLLYTRQLYMFAILAIYLLVLSSTGSKPVNIQCAKYVELPIAHQMYSSFVLKVYYDVVDDQYYPFIVDGPIAIS